MKSEANNKNIIDQELNVKTKVANQSSSQAKISQPISASNLTPPQEKDDLDFKTVIRKDQEIKQKELEKKRILWRKTGWQRKTVFQNSYKLVEVKRVTKVTKGGRRFRFFAVALSGDGKGRVGFGTGKGNEVASARQKAFAQAEKNMVSVSLVNGTIPHTVIGKFCSSKILLKPAVRGTGILVGGAARSVVGLLGITNIRGKSLGSNNKMNLIQATLNGLKKLRRMEEVLALRDLTSPSFIKGEHNNGSKIKS